jgi:hypothetical protein
VQALREAESVAALFPAVRVETSAVDAFVERVAAELPDEDDVPEGVLDSGLSQVGPDETRRAVETWSRPYADRWASLVTAAGDVEAAERALVIGALRIAIAERQRTPHDVLKQLENGRLEHSPYAALAVVVPPSFVWSVDEAHAAAVVRDAHRRPRARFNAVEEVAYALMTFGHVHRTRGLVATLARELPVPELPTASRVVAAAAERVAQDLDGARATTAALLIGYAEELRHI